MSTQCLRIAVVDDDAGIRTALRKLLRSKGHTAVTFESAEEFLASGTAGEFDLMIADLHLPGMTGAALVRGLADRGTPLPAIIITAHDDAASLKMIRQSAPTPHLRKPFSGAQLSEAIERVLSA